MAEVDQIQVGERFGSLLMGVFLFCFGLPFTLVPYLMFSEGGFSTAINESVGITIFMIAFSIPFLLAGLAVQIGGIVAIKHALVPKKGLEGTVQELSEINHENGDDEMSKENFWDQVAS